MKKIAERTSFTLRILFLILFLIIFPLSFRALASADEAAENDNNDGKDNDLKIQLYAETGIEYADNVYALTESQISSMKTNDQEDIASGRFKDMDSLSDTVIEPTMGLKLSSSSLLGGRFGLTSWIKYNYYTKNETSSFPEAKIRLNNSIGENGDLSLEGNFTYGFFKKNYLSGYNDINGNGNISRDERIYSTAVYDEYEGIIAYEHKIIKNKDKIISGLNIRPFAGYGYRRYNSTFSNRDQTITLAGLGLNFEFISRIDLEMIYQYEGVSSPNNKELILINENNAGLDINGDDKTKNNAPLITKIDRSSNRHTIEINPSIKLTKGCQLFAGYKKRDSEYTSDNPMDIEHYNQNATRQEIKSGIKYSFSKAWSAEAEYSKTDNDDDEDGEYSQKGFLVTIKYFF